MSLAHRYALLTRQPAARLEPVPDFVVLLESIEGLVLRPLRTAPTPETWAERLRDRLRTWEGLRDALGLALEDLPEGSLRSHLEPAERVPPETGAEDWPDTLVDEAVGAVEHAWALLAAIAPEAARAEAEQRPLDRELLEELGDELLCLELSALCLHSPGPRWPEVAEEAAWEAWHRARVLRPLLVDAGLHAEALPRESPDETRRRARALQDRRGADDTTAEPRPRRSHVGELHGPRAPSATPPSFLTWLLGTRRSGSRRQSFRRRLVAPRTFGSRLRSRRRS